MNRNNRIAATPYSLGTYFVSGIQVQNTLHKGDDDDDNNNSNKLAHSPYT